MEHEGVLQSIFRTYAEHRKRHRKMSEDDGSEWYQKHFHKHHLRRQRK